MSLADSLNKHKNDLEDIANWCDSTYLDNFKSYFEPVKTLFVRFKSNTRPITDEELEEILTLVPLNLFSVSEVLSKVKAQMEVISLRIKQEKHEVLSNSQATSQAAKKEEAAASVIEDEILLKAYSTLIERVESEISFSRELIMSAKKIWTARKQAETIGVPAENLDTTHEDLPDYMVDLDEIR